MVADLFYRRFHCLDPVAVVVYNQNVVAAHAVRAVNDLNFKAYLYCYRHQAFNSVVLALNPLPALVAIRWLATGHSR